MRTQTLAIAIGAYAGGSWHVTILRSEYQDGRLVNHEITADRWSAEAGVLDSVIRATERLIDLERRRVEIETRRAAPTPASPPRP